MNLMIVENSNYLYERLARLVSRHHNIHVVGHASTEQEAVQDIKRLSPDVVLLDIRLDEGNGFEVLKKVKTPGRPPFVIVLTNYAYPQYRERFLANGADFFFDKSEEIDQMLQALDMLNYRVTAQPKVEPPPKADLQPNVPVANYHTFVH